MTHRLFPSSEVLSHLLHHLSEALLSNSHIPMLFRVLSVTTIFNSQSDNKVSRTSSACHVIYAFLITTLLGFLQLKYQNKNVSPFETHPTNIKAFFLTLCVYCFIQLAKAVFQTHCTSYSLILSHFSLISGVTSSLSLLTIFFPSWLTKLVISIFGVFIPLILGRHWIKVIKQWLGEKTTSAVIYVIDVFRRLMRRNLMQQRPFVV